MIGLGRPAPETAARKMGGRADPHWPDSLRTPQPDRADLDKVQEPFDVVCSKFPNTMFSWDCS